MAERKTGKYANEGSGPESGSDWSQGGPADRGGEAVRSRKKEPESAALDRILGGVGFPATKEEVARQLAVDAFTHGNSRAAELHDLIIQLDDQAFRDLDSLHRAIRDRHVWEKTHDMLA
jgi:hypothetical protein